MGEGRQAPEDAGVADQDVELAEALIERGSESIDGLAVGELERNERGFAARGPDRVVDAFQGLAVAGKQQDMRAFLREFLRDGAADTARGAGDEGDAILEALCRQPTSARKESCFCAGGPSRSLSRVGYSPVKQWSVNCGWAWSRPS